MVNLSHVKFAGTCPMNYPDLFGNLRKRKLGSAIDVFYRTV